MMKEELKPLLKLWEELAPDECKFFIPLDISREAYSIPCFPEHGFSAKTIVFCTTFEYEFSPNLSMLQGVLQELIEKLGWKWTLSGSSYSGYNARIYYDSSSNVNNEIEGSDNHPCVALLRAYLSVKNKLNSNDHCPYFVGNVSGFSCTQGEDCNCIKTDH